MQPTNLKFIAAAKSPMKTERVRERERERKYLQLVFAKIAFAAESRDRDNERNYWFDRQSSSPMARSGLIDCPFSRYGRWLIL